MVRDLVRSIQNMRKDRGLEVTDRIFLFIEGPDSIRQAVESFEEHLLQETLAENYSWKADGNAEEIECGAETCRVGLKKA